jgi:hypothetical protein
MNKKYLFVLSALCGVSVVDCVMDSSTVRARGSKRGRNRRAGLKNRNTTPTSNTTAANANVDLSVNKYEEENRKLKAEIEALVKLLKDSQNDEEKKKLEAKIEELKLMLEKDSQIGAQKFDVRTVLAGALKTLSDYKDSDHFAVNVRQVLLMTAKTVVDAYMGAKKEMPKDLRNVINSVAQLETSNETESFRLALEKAIEGEEKARLQRQNQEKFEKAWAQAQKAQKERQSGKTQDAQVQVGDNEQLKADFSQDSHLKLGPNNKEVVVSQQHSAFHQVDSNSPLQEGGQQGVAPHQTPKEPNKQDGQPLNNPPLQNDQQPQQQQQQQTQNSALEFLNEMLIQATSEEDRASIQKEIQDIESVDGYGQKLLAVQ